MRWGTDLDEQDIETAWLIPSMDFARLTEKQTNKRLLVFAVALGGQNNRLVKDTPALQVR